MASERALVITLASRRIHTAAVDTLFVCMYRDECFERAGDDPQAATDARARRTRPAP